jgi:hypothetical protein
MSVVRCDASRAFLGRNAQRVKHRDVGANRFARFSASCTLAELSRENSRSVSKSDTQVRRQREDHGIAKREIDRAVARSVRRTRVTLDERLGLRARKRSSEFFRACAQLCRVPSNARECYNRRSNIRHDILVCFGRFSHAHPALERETHSEGANLARWWRFRELKRGPGWVARSTDSRLGKTPFPVWP